MLTRNTIAPRKQPRQARAQASRNAILEATVRVLEREGLEAATTTRIAEVAGVSVGTLYQYFAHRDAILDALQDREFERALALMSDVLSRENLQSDPRDTVKRVVRGLATLYEACPQLHRVLVIEGLRVVSADRVHAFDMRVIAIIRHFLAATGTKVRRANVDAAAFVAFQAVRATLLERPAGLDAETLIDELADLVLRYLVEDAPAPSSTPKRARAGRSKAR